MKYATSKQVLCKLIPKTQLLQITASATVRASHMRERERERERGRGRGVRLEIAAPRNILMKTHVRQKLEAVHNRNVAKEIHRDPNLPIHKSDTTAA